MALSQDLSSSLESLVDTLRCAGMGRFIELVALPAGAGDSPLELATLVSLFSSELLHWRSSMSSEMINIYIGYSTLTRIRNYSLLELRFMPPPPPVTAERVLCLSLAYRRSLRCRSRSCVSSKLMPPTLP